MIIHPNTKVLIQFIESDFKSFSITDNIIIRDAQQFARDSNQLILDWKFMCERFWNLSEKAQDLIIKKMAVDSISNIEE